MLSITLTPNGGDIAVTDEFFEVVLEVVAVGLHFAGLVVRARREGVRHRQNPIRAAGATPDQLSRRE